MSTDKDTIEALKAHIENLNKLIVAIKWYPGGEIWPEHVLINGQHLTWFDARELLRTR